MIYTVTFNPAVDYVLYMDTLDLGLVNRSVREEIYYGGKGINVSSVLKNLGTESAALGFVAGFTGEEVERGLKQAGIRTDFIRLEKGLTRINVKIKSAEETDVNGSGPEIGPEALGRLFEKLDELGEGDVLCLAGSIPATLPEDLYETILQRLQGRDIRFVVDATGDLLVNVLQYSPFLIKPNHHELGEIFGKELQSEDEIFRYADELRRMGARNVLVSMAGRGAVLAAEDGMHYKAEVPDGRVKNSVGAGDSMVAGFLVGYLKEETYAHALRMGAAAGSATAFSDGLATQELTHALLDKVCIRKGE